MQTKVPIDDLGEGSYAEVYSAIGTVWVRVQRGHFKTTVRLTKAEIEKIVEALAK